MIWLDLPFGGLQRVYVNARRRDNILSTPSWEKCIIWTQGIISIIQLPVILYDINSKFEELSTSLYHQNSPTIQIFLIIFIGNFLWKCRKDYIIQLRITLRHFNDCSKYKTQRNLTHNVRKSRRLGCGQETLLQNKSNNFVGCKTLAVWTVSVREYQSHLPFYHNVVYGILSGIVTFGFK